MKAVIFDCFGVLLGSAYKTQLAELEATSPEKAEQIRAISHASDRGILSRNEAAQYMADVLGEDMQDVIAEQDHSEVQNYTLLNFIEHEISPKFKTAVLSNISGRDRLAIRFEKGQLDSLFTTVIASGDEGLVKPQPEIYQLVANRLGVPASECIMVDDIQQNCDGATSAGMKAILFTSNKQCIEALRKHLSL